MMRSLAASFPRLSLVLVAALTANATQTHSLGMTESISLLQVSARKALNDPVSVMSSGGNGGKETELLIMPSTDSSEDAAMHFEPFVNELSWTDLNNTGLQFGSGDYYTPKLKDQTWIFGTYHKTGCVFVLKLCVVLGGTGANHVRQQMKDGNFEHRFSALPFSNWFFNPVLRAIHRVPNYRLVHLIREPTDVVVSAYRFHSSADSNEDWLKCSIKTGIDPEAAQDGNHRGNHLGQEYRGYHYEDWWTLHDADKWGILPRLMRNQADFHDLVSSKHYDTMMNFNRSVKNDDSLFTFYNKVSETDGVIVEAYRSAFQLNMMSTNYDRTRWDHQTVQVHMSGLKHNFVNTVHCMFEFLHGSQPGLNVEWAVNHVDKLNVQKYGEHVDGTRNVVGHVGESSNQDNDALLQALNEVQFLMEEKQTMSRTAVNECK